MLPTAYDVRVVALSIVIAVMASGAALDLTGRLTARTGPGRWVWLGGGAVTMGLGIWSMHYTGMMALTLPVPVSFDLLAVGESLGVAIIASGIALLVASGTRFTLLRATLGSVLMATGIVTMHYIGMGAMRMPAAITWHRGLIVLSAVIALVASALALSLGFRLGHLTSDGWTWRKTGSALVMGAAISGMHYTAMAAAAFTPGTMIPDLNGTMRDSVLGAAAIGLGTMLVLVIAIGLSILDRRVMAQAFHLRAALSEVRTLRGLLPICATCKRINAEDGTWQQVEIYVRQRTEAEFTHSVCPSCEAKMLG
jgi:NO-binding membrane sensor protein with MHYT domain